MGLHVTLITQFTQKGFTLETRPAETLHFKQKICESLERKLQYG
jgi:hypothetical protein